MALDYKGFLQFFTRSMPAGAQFSLTAQKCHGHRRGMDAPEALA
jgi:hypothetical protein